MPGVNIFGKSKIIIEAKVTRKDGTVEDLGEVASSDKGNLEIGPALKRLFGRIKNKKQ